MDWRKDALSEYEARRIRLTEERDEAQGKLSQYQSAVAAANAAITELDRAVAVLGIVPIQDGEPPAHVVVERQERDGKGDRRFKDLALELLEGAYPGPLRAGHIQHRVEQALGRKFHAKTAGMTLFRLSKDGLARREGWDWYFVPEDQRGSAASSHDDAAQKKGGIPLTSKTI